MPRGMLNGRCAADRSTPPRVRCRGRREARRPRGLAARSRGVRAPPPARRPARDAAPGHRDRRRGRLDPGRERLWGAVAALALLVVFTGGIAGTLIAGRRPDCHCFGQLYSAPIGWGTLVRNGIMIAVAAFVVAQGEAGASVIALAESAASAGSMLWLSGGLAVALVILGIETWLLIEVVQPCPAAEGSRSRPELSRRRHAERGDHAAVLEPRLRLLPADGR